jgi:hypothetical protein
MPPDIYTYRTVEYAYAALYTSRRIGNYLPLNDHLTSGICGSQPVFYTHISAHSLGTVTLLRSLQLEHYGTSSSSNLAKYCLLLGYHPNDLCYDSWSTGQSRGLLVDPLNGKIGNP